MRLAGKNAIVTGGGRGIGETIALALAAEGCSVAIAGRSKARLERVAGKIRETGRESIAVRCDVTDPHSVKELFGKAKQKWEKLDILVNNAGQSHSELLARLNIETWNHMLAVNLTSAFLCCQAALGWMLPQKSGRIINIASTAAKIGFRYAGAYAAAKHGVLGLTRSMALETAASGITVNAVCPGWVETDMVQNAVATISAKTRVSAEKAREYLANDSPQKRILDPEEIASTVVFLACEQARGITGQAIDVSGGQVMS